MIKGVVNEPPGLQDEIKQVTDRQFNKRSRGIIAP